MRPKACWTSQENREYSISWIFLCLHLGGIHYTKNLKTKINLTELYPSTHTEIKLLHFLIKEGKHAEKKKKYKPTIPAFTPAWYLPKQMWSRRSLQF